MMNVATKTTVWAVMSTEAVNVLFDLRWMLVLVIALIRQICGGGDKREQEERCGDTVFKGRTKNLQQICGLHDIPHHRRIDWHGHL